MIQYGFQRLALLNSGGYQRAEMPLDAAVSLIAPNNTGKTSLINALQFLLIIDKRSMDFGAHDAETSRRFYFPDTSAYILLEISLPSSGTVVVGCVGKGVSHEYEYFAYQGELDLNDFRTDTGQTVRQPQLVSHLASKQKRVFTYRQDDFTHSLYGQRTRRSAGEPDIRIFQLKQAALIKPFQRVMGQTLKLETLSASKIKEHLLNIFSHELHDADIDFKANWDKAFADVEADRSQYSAAFRQKDKISRLEQVYARRQELRGKILYLRPIVERQLEEWQIHYLQNKEALAARLVDITTAEAAIKPQEHANIKRQGVLEHQRQALDEQDTQCQLLNNKLALYSHRGILEQHHATATQALENAIIRIGQVSERTTESLNRELKQIQTQQQQCQRELANLGDNLYLHLKKDLPPDQLDLLNRWVNQQTMTLPAPDFDLDSTSLSHWLTSALSQDHESLQLPGLTIRLHNLSPQYQQRDHTEIQAELADIASKIRGLHQQLDTSADLELAKRQKKSLETDLSLIQKELEEFDAWQALLGEQEHRQAQRHTIEQELATIKTALDSALDTGRRLYQQRLEIHQLQAALEEQNKKIGDRRVERRDHSDAFSNLDALPLRPWVSTMIPPLNDLEKTLQGYLADCKELPRLNSDCAALLNDIRKEGLNKFYLMDSEETEAEAIISFAHHLPQEQEAIERKARSAVVEVTVSLRALQGNLNTFKSLIHDFNRLIGKRKLSDLAVFKINAVDDPMLVGAMEQLITTAETVDSQGTYALFDQASVLDDNTINLAKERLIKAGEQYGGLRVEHFFELEFEVGKKGHKPESFKEMDKAASNGTVLMAKLITGLAMLHLMQDPRHRVRTICYLDEALALDPANQRSLIDTADGFGFSLILASPAPLITARYCVPITTINGQNQISRHHWQRLDPIDPEVKST